MKSKQHLNPLKLALVVGSLALPLIAQAEQQQSREHPRYQLIDLGTFRGPSSTSEDLAQIVNNRGTVVGGADTLLPDPFAPDCASPSCFVQHAFQWQGGVLTDLGTLPGGSSSWAEALNENGQIVGGSRVSFVPSQVSAFLWEKGGPMIDLNTLIPADSSLHLVIAKHINDRGEIPGTAVPRGVGDDSDEALVHAFLLIPIGEE